MIIKMRLVTIRAVPERVKKSAVKDFVQELQKASEGDRPRIVLDCSKLRRMDCSAIYLLVSCLEEAMKLNGNVKLACVRPVAQATLRAAGVDHLFEIYSSVTDAELSYQHLHSQVSLRKRRTKAAEQAAADSMIRNSGPSRDVAVSKYRSEL